jgi:hypothetical protein
MPSPINRCHAKTPAAAIGHKPHGWIKVALVFCGLLILTQDGLRESGNFLTMAVMLIQSGQSARLLDASIHLTGILALVKLALGILLIIKARTLARWIELKNA